MGNPEQPERETKSAESVQETSDFEAVDFGKNTQYLQTFIELVEANLKSLPRLHQDKIKLFLTEPAHTLQMRTALICLTLCDEEKPTDALSALLIAAAGIEKKIDLSLRDQLLRVNFPFERLRTHFESTQTPMHPEETSWSTQLYQWLISTSEAPAATSSRSPVG